MTNNYIELIKENPNNILNIKDLNNDIVSLALEHGYIPKKEDFITNPKLKDYKILLNKALINDPTVIIFYRRNKLTDDIVTYAFNHGYIPKEEDILENDELRHSSLFMKMAIETDPKLIVLVTKDCLLSTYFIKEVFTKYKITKEDLQNYPELTRNTNIMNLLPEYRNYYAFLDSEEKKKIIIEFLEDNFNLNLVNLPFLDNKINGKCTKDILSKFIKYLKLNIDESTNTQKKYYYILDKIIDGIINIRYLKAKSIILYPDIITLNKKMNEVFNKTLNTDDYTYIDNFAKNLYLFTCKSISLEEITKELYNFFDFYLKNKILHIKITSSFCNKILNFHRNVFFSKEKEKILENITSKLRLSNRKLLSINNGIKINKVASLLKSKDFSSLNLSKDEIKSIIEDTKNSIINNKDIKKSGIIITSSLLDKIIYEYLFLGNTDKNIINDLLGTNNEEVINYIFNKILQIRYKLIKYIKLDDNELVTTNYFNLPKLNYSNYLILDNNRYIDNVADLLINLDDNLLNKILDNKELLQEIIFLLPLVNLTKEFDTKTFINIISNYKRIKDRLSKNYSDIDIKDLIFKKFDDFINLGNGYNSVDDITVAALGSNVVDILGEEHSNEYTNIYLDMLPRKMGAIPPVLLEYNGYYLESGLYTDSERLLIGKIPNKASCIDLFNPAGYETYKEALLGNLGDVILIRDNEKKLISRILLFRRGNIINMATGNNAYPIEMYTKIAEQIMKQAITKQDNIDYVLVDVASVLDNLPKLPIVSDGRFMEIFPHADYDDTAILLSSKNMINGILDRRINANYGDLPKSMYFKLRKNINYNPSENDITRLRALNILLETDLNKKEILKRNFEPFYMKKYAMVVCGEDWYIAIKNDNSVEEIVLPTADMKSDLEINYVKDTFLKEGKNL